MARSPQDLLRDAESLIGDGPSVEEHEQQLAATLTLVAIGKLLVQIKGALDTIARNVDGP